jgi:hypothetical protein
MKAAGRVATHRLCARQTGAEPYRYMYRLGGRGGVAWGGDTTATRLT